MGPDLKKDFGAGQDAPSSYPITFFFPIIDANSPYAQAPQECQCNVNSLAMTSHNGPTVTLITNVNN